MLLDSVLCDDCRGVVAYPSGINDHRHTYSEIGGVPQNSWTPRYTLPSDSHLVEEGGAQGIGRFGRYLPFPVDPHVTCGEGGTPLIELTDLVACPGANVYLKDETRNPTASFKDRGMALMVSEARRLGYAEIAIPSTGNAAISLAHYASRAGLRSVAFVPTNISPGKKERLKRLSEIVYAEDLVTSYERFMRFVREERQVYNGLPANNIPFIQGLKTIAFETFLQLGGRVPDYVIVPVGSGANVVGQFQGYGDLILLGLAQRLPRLVTVQIMGADPISVGYELQMDDAPVVIEPVATRAEAIASDTCFNHAKIMRSLRASQGRAVSVTDDAIDLLETAPFAQRLEFSSRAVFAALEKLGTISGNVVLIGTAAARD